MSDGYEGLSPHRQALRRREVRDRLEWAALKAETGETDASLDGLIRQQRLRGRVATSRTFWVLGSLVFTTLLGLGYYVGVPIWLQIQDAARRGFESLSE